MSKWTKLYERLLDNPSQPISFSDLEGLLRAFGFVHKRTKGSHKTYKHPKVPPVLTIQPNGKDAVSYQVDRFLELVKQFDLHIAE